MSTVFISSIKRESTITVDGYSSAKSVKCALRDFGRYIAKRYDKLEGEALIVETDEDAEDILSVGNGDASEFGIVVEEVPCASRWNEETDEMEYRDGYNYYVMVRFVR